MRVIQSVAELQAELGEWRRQGESIALVPTMGNLHAGHASLVQQAVKLAERVVASVFVNPLQFGPRDDFARYPRTLDADARLLKMQGAHVLFAPSVADVYPGGYPPATTVRVRGALDEVLEAEFRRGHFEGVATVVTILFNLVRPDVALFGEKDFQQLAVIRRMVADLGIPVRVYGAPTVREADGLAMSSRNQYLSEAERRLAPEIHASLMQIQSELQDGRRDFSALSTRQVQRLSALGFTPQYVEVRSPDLGAPDTGAAAYVVVIAALLGTTRLIDNVLVRIKS